MFKLITHHYCPEDQYIKEIAEIEIILQDGSKQRFIYVRKEMKAGGMYWGPISCSAMINGEKQHFKSPIFDSNFLERDIKEFLNNRAWERQQPKVAMQGNAFSDSYKLSAATTDATVKLQPSQYEQTSFLENCPF